MIKKHDPDYDLPLFSISDLCERWNYTKAGIHKLSQKEDFPKPIALVNKGKTKIFSKNDIVAYERDRPWLFSESLKSSRQYGYFYAKRIKGSLKD